jgi:hypothetical protein
MPLTRRILLRWLQLAGAATACCLLLAVITQQLWREDANDPQLELAREAARRLAAGAGPAEAVAPLGPVDFAHSLAPFLMVLDDRGAILASSGRLNGALRTVPPGVLDAVRRSGEERVSWQPEAGARLATVVVRARAGFVVAGRSLLESERRTAHLHQLLLVGWIGILVGLAALVAVTERVLDWGR